MNDIGVGIITDGKEPDKLADTLAAIERQRDEYGMPVEEIVIAGAPSTRHSGIGVIAKVEEAENGRLGAMRNALVRVLHQPYILLLDDDMILQDDFYEGLQKYTDENSWDVLSCRILNPDGSRFWDWAEHRDDGSHLLDYGVESDHVYITGGFCFARRGTLLDVKWDDKLGFYQSEDVDFSKRLKEAGYRIDFNPYSTVIHDANYTQEGRSVMRT